MVKLRHFSFTAKFFQDMGNHFSSGPFSSLSANYHAFISGGIFRCLFDSFLFRVFFLELLLPRLESTVYTDILHLDLRMEKTWIYTFLDEDGAEVNSAD